MFTCRITDESAVEINTHMVERAADLFGLLATPVRLRTILELRSGEKPVGERLAGVQGGQANMSQHLTMMYRARLVARGKQGAQVYCRIANESVVSACRIVCAQVALTVTRGMRLPFYSAARPAYRKSK